MKTVDSHPLPAGVKKAVSKEVFIFLIVFLGFFVALCTKMGTVNMFNTMMKTAYDLLMSTVFYIMAIAVLAGAISALFSEFGVISLLNKLLSPVIKVVYGLPGASAVGVFTTYLSDNPAILTLANDNNFRRYFKKYQLPALTNIGTAFGMGLIITTFMAGLDSPIGESFGLAVLVGNIGAIVGSIVSTRLMLWRTAKIYGKEEMCDVEDNSEAMDVNKFRKVREGSVASRFLDALLDGGKSGVDMGLSVIPGVLIICTIIMMLTNGAGESGYTGAAYEGIAILPWIGDKLSFILQPLFGFQSSEAIAVPITALGAAGAATGVAEKLVAEGLANAHDIAVFTSMCMCWSGYLSTHVAMMDSLKCSKLTGTAIICHTIGGLCAGVFANWFYQLLILIV
jgi:spore maturation protein SpmB